MTGKTAVVAGLAVTAVGVAVLAQQRAASRPADPPLELTPGHRGGAGSPLLLVHGVTASWRVWSPILTHLEPHHEVLAPTLLGHAGASLLDPQVPPSVGALTDGIEAELDRAGFGRVHVVGNSLGGWIAIELARRGRALSLVLLSPGGASRSQRRLEATAAAIRLSVQGLARFAGHADAIASQPALRWLLSYSQVAHPRRISPEDFAASIRAAASAPVVDELLRVLPQRQVEPLPADRDYPIRLIWPQHDRVLPFDNFGVPMVERLPDAEVIRITGAGHVPMSDDPTTIARLILEVTQKADSRGCP